MSGPGADIAPCAQAGVCSSDPGLMVTASGVRDGVRRKIYVQHSAASGAFPKLIVHGIKHCGQYKYLNGLARINCNLAQALLATPKL